MRQTAHQTGVSVLAVLFLCVSDELVIREENTFLLLKVRHALGVLDRVGSLYGSSASLKNSIVADSRLVKKAVERACHRCQIHHA